MKYLLAFDGGATRTRVGLYSARGELQREAEGGPSNPQARGVSACVRVLTGLARALMPAEAAPDCVIAAGIAGAGEAGVQESVARALLMELAAERVILTHDLTPLLQANVGLGAGIIVIAGTGSSVMARNSGGQVARVGGWGALFGDVGSAHEIALAGLRACAAALDADGYGTALVDALTGAAGLESFGAFKGWVASASKSEVAALASVVSLAAEQGDSLARDCLEAQAAGLAAQTAQAISSIELAPNTPVILHGGVFECCSTFRTVYRQCLEEAVGAVSYVANPVEGHEAVKAMAMAEKMPDRVTVVEGGHDRVEPATEQRLREGPPLESLDALGMVESMSREDGAAAAAVARAASSIAAAVEAVAAAFASGGRLVYVGAGTSGRLGVLDASECPPTFGVPPERVVAIIAGGREALERSVEGAEDDTAQAARDLKTLAPALSDADVVVGIAASGTTPYVLAALEEGARLGARTVFLCCNPGVATSAASIVIALDTGPEVVAGSTRLKAGTATKMVLNQLTTGAMVLSGYVYDGLMVRVKPVNAKLRRRAIRIVSELTGRAWDDAEALLAESDDRIPVAVLVARLGVGVEEAEARLDSAGGGLRAALEG